MHMRGTPRTMQQNPHYDDVVAEVAQYLSQCVAAARAAGLGPDRIAIDPGIGFGKTVEHNRQLIAGLGRLAALGHPVLLGASRKSFLATLAHCADVEDRDLPTAVLTALGYGFGARLFRVHAVYANLQALRLAEALAAR
jgi:dihydropteroate synthase